MNRVSDLASGDWYQAANFFYMVVGHIEGKTKILEFSADGRYIGWYKIPSDRPVNFISSYVANVPWRRP